MDLTKLNTGKGLAADLEKINTLQAKHATAGARVVLGVVDGNNNVLSNEADLKAAIGATAYNTIAETALASLNTELGNTKTTKQASFDAL